MKKLYFILALCTFLISGCGKPTNALQYFNDSKFMAKAIPYTKKTDLLDGKQVDVMLFATYLNSIDKKFESEKKEYFLIGIQDVKTRNYLLKADQLTLNDEDAIEIIKIKNTNKLIKNIALKSVWATYYLVTFDSKDDIFKLNLQFKYNDEKQMKLSFKK